MLSFSNTDKVLVLAPHPDDESLGTGGLAPANIYTKDTRPNRVRDKRRE